MLLKCIRDGTSFLVEGMVMFMPLVALMMCNIYNFVVAGFYAILK
jgi:hypothetical protein